MASAKRVLLIDDHPDVRLGLRLALKQLDFPLTIAEAGTCTAGIAALAETDFDLVLLDLNLPDADGLEVIHFARKRKYAGKVLVYSARDEAVFAEKCRQAGASGFVPKTRELGEVTAAIQVVLGGNTCFRY